MSRVWTEVHWRRWEANDGAVVRWDNSSPHPNPANPRSRMWIAFGPGADEYDCLKAFRMRRGRRRSDRGYPRRWKTAQAAMRAVDETFPPAVQTG